MKLESLLHSVVLRLFAWCPPRRPAFLSSLWSSVPWSAWHLLRSEKPEHKGTQWGGEKDTLSCTIRDIQKALPRLLSVCVPKKHIEDERRQPWGKPRQEGSDCEGEQGNGPFPCHFSWVCASTISIFSHPYKPTFKLQVPLTGMSSSLWQTIWWWWITTLHNWMALKLSV